MVETMQYDVDSIAINLMSVYTKQEQKNVVSFLFCYEFFVYNERFCITLLMRKLYIHSQKLISEIQTKTNWLNGTMYTNVCLMLV